MCFVVIGKTNLGINPSHSCQQNSTLLTLGLIPYSPPIPTLHTPQICRATIIVSQAHQAFAYAVPYTWSALLLLGHPVNSHSCHRSQDRHHLLREAFPKWPSHQLTVSPDLMPGGSHAVLMAHFSALAGTRFPNCGRRQTHLECGNLHLPRFPAETATLAVPGTTL